MSSYYNRPFLMCPYRIVIEVFIEDVTNSSSDLSWISGADYAFLRDEGYVNTTFTPSVAGDFGDSEGYAINQTEWTYWSTMGLRTVSSSLERGISSRDWDLTGYQVGDRYSILSMDMRFNPDSSLYIYQWSLLLELAIILEGAELLAGHQFQFTVETTMTWIPFFVFSQPGGYTQSMNVTRGDGIADNGIQDYTLYMIEGDVEIDYFWGTVPP